MESGWRGCAFGRRELDVGRSKFVSGWRDVVSGWGEMTSGWRKMGFGRPEMVSAAGWEASCFVEWVFIGRSGLGALVCAMAGNFFVYSGLGFSRVVGWSMVIGVAPMRESLAGAARLAQR